MPKGTLLDRDKDFINMGTYNYGGDWGSHTSSDVFTYNVLFGKGNVGENVQRPVLLDDEILKRINKYRQEIGVE